MASDEGINAGLALVTAGFSALGIALSRYRKKRKFEDVAQIDVLSAAQGLAELSGFAWANAQYQNFEGKAVAFISWKLLVPKDKDKWITVSHGSVPEGFVLQDKSGAAWVNMDNADFDSQSRSFYWKKMTPENRNLFLSWLPTAKKKDPDFPPVKGHFETTYRIDIQELQIGCPVVAQGNFYTSRKETLGLLSGFSSFKERFLKLKKNTAYSTSMLDANKDGVISEDEHRMGHVYMAGSAMKSVANGPTVPEFQQEMVEISGHLIGSNNHKLIVANTNEVFFLAKLGKWNAFLFVLGAMMVAGGVCTLFKELKLF